MGGGGGRRRRGGPAVRGISRRRAARSRWEDAIRRGGAAVGEVEGRREEGREEEAARGRQRAHREAGAGGGGDGHVEERHVRGGEPSEGRRRDGFPPLLGRGVVGCVAIVQGE